MHWSHVLGRIAFRTGVGMWRHRLTWLLGGLVLLVFGVYELGFAGPASVANGDCADAAMAALTHADESTARAAYACLDSGMRNTTEDAFVNGIRQRAAPNGQFDRIADKRTEDGGRIVFYTVQSGTAPTVGYIVYLDAQGKITRVE